MRPSTRGYGLIAIMAALALGCSSSTEGSGSSSSSGGSSSGGTPVSSAECANRCESKATECGATASQATQTCSSVCGSSTKEQLDCLAGKTCQELANAASLSALCPSSSTSSSSSSSGGSTGGTKQLGQACSCGEQPEAEEGLCSGTDEDCASGLSCIYEVRSKGKGVCYGERCCTKTADCDADSSLLTKCSKGTCTKTNLGYYCAK